MALNCSCKTWAALRATVSAQRIVELVHDAVQRQGAVIRPFVAEDAVALRQAEAEEEILELQRLGQGIAASWVSPKSAVDLIDKQRG